jgi:hypothetical protein
MTAMQSTSEALGSLNESVAALDQRLRSVERQEVERLVRIELERMLSRTIIERDANANTPPPSR